jgi:hypothetical protein
MAFLSLIIFFQSLSFALVPPAMSLISSYNRNLRKIDTIKIENNIKYGIQNKEIKETLWFKKGQKYRVYVKKGDASILFIRQGDSCIAISEGKKIKTESLCKNLNINIFYNLIFPSSSFFSFLKNSGLDIDFEENQIKHLDGKYILPEKVSLARYNSKPIYILGLKQETLNSKIKNLKSMEKAIDSIKEKSSQIWFNVKDGKLIRFYGFLNNVNYELNMNNFEEKNEEFSFPKYISLDCDDDNFYTYKIDNFSFNLKLDDTLFDIKNYEKKYTKNLPESSLSKDEKELLGYLKNFR